MENPSTLLVVHNLETSKQFYINILGLQFIEEHQGGVKLTLGSHVVLMFEGTKNTVDYQHGYHANATLIFTVTDLDEKIAELKQKGVQFVHASPHHNKWGRYIAFSDPSGIVHELMQWVSEPLQITEC